MKEKGFNLKICLVCIALPVVLGLLSGLLNAGAYGSYGAMRRPPLSPPGIVFPIVWSILYLLMGISCCMVSQAPVEKEKKLDALFTYGIQLFVNLLWPFIFFNLKAYLLAFIWLLFLWVLVLRMIIQFNSIKPLAGYLQIPYLLWCSFALYLNLGVYLLES